MQNNRIIYLFSYNFFLGIRAITTYSFYTFDTLSHSNSFKYDSYKHNSCKCNSHEHNSYKDDSSKNNSYLFNYEPLLHTNAISLVPTCTFAEAASAYCTLCFSTLFFPRLLYSTLHDTFATHLHFY